MQDLLLSMQLLKVAILNTDYSLISNYRQL